MAMDAIIQGPRNDFLIGDVDMPPPPPPQKKKNHNNETNNTMQKEKKSSSGGVGRELPSWGL